MAAAMTATRKPALAAVGTAAPVTVIARRARPISHRPMRRAGAMRRGDAARTTTAARTNRTDGNQEEMGSSRSDAPNGGQAPATTRPSRMTIAVPTTIAIAVSSTRDHRRRNAAATMRRIAHASSRSTTYGPSPVNPNGSAWRNRMTARSMPARGIATAPRKSSPSSAPKSRRTSDARRALGSSYCVVKSRPLGREGVATGAGASTGWAADLTAVMFRRPAAHAARHR